MATYCVVMPIFQRDCRFIPSVPLLLDESVSAKSMSNEHIGTLIKRRRTLGDWLNNKTKCVLVESGNQEATTSSIESIALISTFVLNVFAQEGSMMFEEAFIIKNARSSSLVRCIPLLNLTPRPNKNYRIENNSDPSEVKTLYASVAAALKADKSLATSLRRYNAAMSREVVEDKIIDLTICLESIFNAQTEVSFRFSLYNAILGEPDTAKRYELFVNLKRLYNDRSNVVHGTKEFKSEWFEQMWKVLIKTAKLSLMKKIDFLQVHPAKDWQEALDKQALGV